MSLRGNYYKLGLFIIIGTCLFVAGLIVLGATKFFQERVIMTTFVNESVNGLEVGSPVKLRGVKIGSVSKIGFMTGKESEHAPHYRYVLIEGSLSDQYFEYFRSMTKEEIKKHLDEEVQEGLRVRPTSQGLTGQLFLDINYVDPKLNPPLELDWKPKGFYIPSAPSTMSRIEQAFNTISEALNSLHKSDIGAGIKDLKVVAEGLSNLLKEADLGKIGKNITGNLDETRALLARLNRILGAPEAETLVPDASKTMAGLRRIVESSEGDVIAAVHDLRKASEGLKSTSTELSDYLKDPELKQDFEKFPQTLRNLNTASAKVDAAATQLNEVLRRLNGLVASQQINIQGILENIRLLIENLKELSSEAKRYPSGVLFGEPPDKVKR